MQEFLASKANLKAFYNLLVNTLFTSVMNFTVWFAITFFVYIETQSVFAVSLIAGLYLIATAATGIWFGSLVDHHKKKTVMATSGVASLIFYSIAFLIYITVDREGFKDPANIALWALVISVMSGVVAGNIRMIAMPTLVTILIPEDRRDKANGLVGTTSGVSFLVTSVISGLLVASSGMYAVLLLAIGILAAGIIHLSFIRVPEKSIAHSGDEPKKIDIKGTFRLVRAVPGLVALILLTTFNNFLGGVFMALMDAYGLSLVSVEIWGILWGVLSTGLIIGGLVIAKIGLGKNPLKTLLWVNIILWTVSIGFPLQNSIILLAIGMFIYMFLMPYAEASEQTILQKVVPFERQGRVFGFAQSVEQSASPLTAFLIGPIAQFIFIPFMTDGEGAKAIGSWFGTGPSRGIALVFILAGVIGLIATSIAFGSKYYRDLSKQYLESSNKTNLPPLDAPIKEGLAQ